MAWTEDDSIFIGTMMSFFFFGLYTVVFGLYIKLVKNRKSSRLTVMDYTIGFLYVLTGATVIIDAIQEFEIIRRGRTTSTDPWVNRINSTTSVTMVLLDYVAQVVLIYRCWIVWNRNYWVAAPPFVIAIGSAASGLAVSLSYAMNPGDNKSLPWWVYAGSSWVILSLIVNAMVSTLMIYKIWTIHMRTKGLLLSSGRLDLSWIVSMLVESALVLFVGQLVYVILYWIDSPQWMIVVLPVTNLYGLCCTFIMVVVAEKRNSDTSTSHETSASVVVLSTRSRAGRTAHESSYSETASTLRPKGGIEVGIEFNTYSDRPLDLK
ncbi:hypothetical protein FA13DRAFT_1732599 [Coprinellus micaceus]|uniref:Uncharacterized protein n=1 Tax=Coprinellus micaceus TaxID=71717 RepID=A0A4Y7TC14_COPMI|nr:hypothetical protein FA13DRAFT_1732599 [Coprinellus micaceus]